ncbi:MAG TPA: hypothetical protein PKD26_07385 [Pyrinomonadaceae bacterium]|nr:hypothetical protein [Pyrinomonadaceae bacterium]
MTNNVPNKDSTVRSVAAQALIGLAFWMTFGLILEGLIGFRSPSYLLDPTRRELLRLAHAHGAIFSILLLALSLGQYAGMISPPRAAVLSLRIGTILMPVGFLLGGIWLQGSDPGPGIFLAPLGGLMIIFGVITMAVAFLTEKGSDPKLDIDNANSSKKATEKS